MLRAMLVQYLVGLRVGLDRDAQRLVNECVEGDVLGSHGLILGGALPFEVRAIEPTVRVLLRVRHVESSRLRFVGGGQIWYIRMRSRGS